MVSLPNTWSDKFFSLHHKGSLAGVIWMHLEHFEVGPIARRWRATPSTQALSEVWVVIDYAYGSGPQAVHYTDDMVGGTIEEAGSLWTDGDTHVVEDEDGRREYSVKALSPDRAAWVRSWFPSTL